MKIDKLPIWEKAGHFFSSRPSGNEYVIVASALPSSLRSELLETTVECARCGEHMNPFREWSAGKAIRIAVTCPPDKPGKRGCSRSRLGHEAMAELRESVATNLRQVAVEAA